MEFRIADTFTDSLARLTGDEQKAAKTTAFDLQLDSSHPGLKFHRLDHSKDKNFYSVRVSNDIRLIVHKTTGSLLLCYVDHHDKAYAWAERRRLETHPKTGAAQMVEIRETVQEIIVPHYVTVPEPTPTAKSIFAGLSDDDLLGCGVPSEWLRDVREATEDSLLALADHLPAEAAEALLEIATGGRPQLAASLPPSAGPFEHPDAQRRFRIMNDVEELSRALEYPWDKWTVFLHPAQRQLVESDYAGPARVSGSAGTGKTVVALHRAAFLVSRHPQSRVLLTTFSAPLANALRTQVRRLISDEPRLGERLDVHALDDVGERLYERHFGRPKIASRDTVERFITETATAVPGQTPGPRFLFAEWTDVVDAWQLGTWDRYRDVQRLGRKTRLTEAQRLATWSILETVRARLRADGYVTRAQMFSRLAEQVAARRQPVYDFIVADEAQDMSVPQLRFLASLGAHRPDGLFFTGDLGQRIFQQPFSWQSLGVDVRGRSRTLHVNYRTSHQIRAQADRLLAREASDVDGNVEERRGTVSVFNGPSPLVRTFKTAEEESDAVAGWLTDRRKEGLVPHELAIFVRSGAEIDRAQSAVGKSELPFRVLDESIGSAGESVTVGAMHLAKGLEFRAVAVMACDDEVIPSQKRIEESSDESDLAEVYNTERHLLYVACTRARDQLLVTGVQPISEFVSDLQA